MEQLANGVNAVHCGFNGTAGNCFYNFVRINNKNEIIAKNWIL